MSCVCVGEGGGWIQKEPHEHVEARLARLMVDVLGRPGRELDFGLVRGDANADEISKAGEVVRGKEETAMVSRKGKGGLVGGGPERGWWWGFGYLRGAGPWTCWRNLARDFAKAGAWTGRVPDRVSRSTAPAGHTALAQGTLQRLNAVQGPL